MESDAPPRRMKSTSNEESADHEAELHDLMDQAELNEKILQSELQKQRIAEFQRIKSLQRNRVYSLTLAVCGFLISVIGYFYAENNIDIIIETLARHAVTLLGIAASVFSVFLYFSSGNRISDVDFLRRASRRAEHSLNPQAAWPFPIGDEDEGAPENFRSMITEMTSVLQAQAETYDEKASALLDKGIFYAASGIAFFFFSIVAWQVIFHLWGFNQFHVYGIVSCASLFIAVEIISAWFLKQYRNFIDSSTELLKIKAIFDKFLLLKLACDESTNAENLNQQLGTTLARDIVWPERPTNTSNGKIEMKTLNDMLSMVQKLIKDTKGDT